MRRSNRETPLGFVRLDARRKQPLFQQLYEAIRTAILDGQLPANSRIPSSRELVQQLGISRTTVVTALDQLIAEGYLQTVVGSGTYVSRDIPVDRPFQHQSTPSKKTHSKTSAKTSSSLAGCLSSYANQFYDNQWEPVREAAEDVKAFLPGVPALDQFPLEVWSKLVRRIWKYLVPRDLSYGAPAGYAPLRTAIAKYVNTHRGVHCDADQVILTNGTQHAIDLVAQMFLESGDEVLFENPGYNSGRNAFRARGAKLVPLSVDARGVDVKSAQQAFPNAKLVYVTPSHQYPMGLTLPIENRMELLQWAKEKGRMIVEDDYDSEFRYGQKPIPALQGLDSSNRVLYIGSLSKVAFPALGMGYLIVPKDFAQVFESALATQTRPTSMVDQFVLHEFLREGHFARHLRRMRKIHAERREVFVQEMDRHLSDVFELVGSQAGLHCTAILRSGRSDEKVHQLLLQKGILTRPLSEYYQADTPDSKRQQGLVFGFASATPGQTRYAIRQIAQTL